MDNVVNVSLLGTKVLDYTHYIDIWSIDGAIKTFLMHKTAEPNVFGVLKLEEGNVVDEMAAAFYSNT